MTRRVGILTGGGDVPGLNSVIRDVTYRAARAKEPYEIVGIKRGWGGLIYMDPNGKGDDPEHIKILSPMDVRTIYRYGGTVLHTSRVNPLNITSDPELQKYRGLKFKQNTDLTNDVVKNLERLKLDYLIAVGGDDTLSYALHLHKKGMKVIGIPKTMDGDVAGTDYCLGFSSAVSKATKMITELRTCLGSHERFGVLEEFGRNSGFTALYTAFASKPDRVLIPEVDFDLDHLVELLINDKQKNPSNYAIVLVAEGAKHLKGQIIYEGSDKDSFGHQKLGGIGKVVADYISKKTGYQAISETLRYLIRSGEPDAKDIIVGTIYANIAFDAILRGESGKLAACSNGRYSLVPLELVSASPRKVDVQKWYHTERYRPNYENFDGQGLII